MMDDSFTKYNNRKICNTYVQIYQSERSIIFFKETHTFHECIPEKIDTA